MGRLFTTPEERAQLDAQRSQAASMPGASSPGGAPGAPGTPGLPGAAAVPGIAGAPGGVGGGGARGADGAGGLVDAACAGGAAGAGYPGAPGANASAACPPEADGQQAPGLLLGGIVRRGKSRPMVIVNGEVQPAPAGAVMRGTVTLQADGRSVVLKPGQRYDPATGEIHEAAR